MNKEFKRKKSNDEFKTRRKDKIVGIGYGLIPVVSLFIIVIVFFLIKLMF